VHIAIDPDAVRWQPDVEEAAALQTVLERAGGPEEPSEIPDASDRSETDIVKLAILAGLGIAALTGAVLLILALRIRFSGR
jgi:hypothetical protein